jgi:hypothetical protein
LASPFHRCLDLPDINSVVGVCLEELRLSPHQCNPAALLTALYRNLLKEDDAEGYVVTTALFARLQDPEVALLPAREFLIETARQYVAQTSHLFPLLHRQSSAALTVCRVANRGRIRLLLRDALIFWPSLLVLRPQIVEVPFDFVVFTRPLRDNGREPLVFAEDGEGVLKRSSHKAEPRTLVLDVGLYGTLVKELDRRGFFGGDGSVFFFGSRNPHIPGFLNDLWLGKQPINALVQTQDVVRYVDTVECLLKPFVFVPCPDSSAIFMELGDGISFVCSVVFLWSLHRYSTRAAHNDSDRPDAHLRSSTNGLVARWLLEEPIPAWSKAQDFVASWSSRDLTSPSEFREWLNRRMRAGQCGSASRG